MLTTHHLVYTSCSTVAWLVEQLPTQRPRVVGSNTVWELIYTLHYILYVLSLFLYSWQYLLPTEKASSQGYDGLVIDYQLYHSGLVGRAIAYLESQVCGLESCLGTQHNSYSACSFYLIFFCLSIHGNTYLTENTLSTSRVPERRVFGFKSTGNSFKLFVCLSVCLSVCYLII